MTSEQLEKLERIARLKEQGILTEDEAQAQKVVILGQNPVLASIEKIEEPFEEAEEEETPQTGFKLAWWHILLGIGLLLYAYARFGPQDPKPKEEPKIEESEPERTSILTGDMVILTENGYAATSLETYKAYLKAATANDDYGIGELLAGNLIFPVKSGIDARVLDFGFGWYQLRILSGPYKGTSCYYPREWVRKI